MTARKQNKPTREQLLTALDKLRAADEVRAKERRRPMTPTDLRRIGELIGNQSLNADEMRELETLQARFDVDRVRRDQGGEVVRTHIGDFFPAGDKRKARISKALRFDNDRLRPDATTKRRQTAGRRDAVKNGAHTPPVKNAAGKLNAEYEAAYRAYIAKGKKPAWICNQVAIESGLKDAEKARFKESLRKYAIRHKWNV
jgi:hypothetical protein